MGIFDFLKKITEKKKSRNINGEKLTFSDIENWIEKKKKEIEIKEKNLFVLIKTRISHFTNELETKINVVKSLDINARKVDDRFKSATEEGRSRYIENLGYLIRNLNNLQENKAEKLMFSIDRLFSDFNKISHMSYERATILIGKEMGNIKNELKVFSRNLVKVFDENKYIINISQTISAIEAKLKQYKETNKDEERNVDKIAHLNKEISKREEESEGISEEIEKIKKSSEYLGHLKILDECASLKEDIEKNFISLIQIVDFKALGNFYHIFEDKMERVKSYRDKFRINFEKDDGAEISRLLDAAKLNNQKISNKINEINSKREILKNKIEEASDKTRNLSVHIKKNILEIDEMKNLKAREEKRLEKIKASSGEIVSEIRKDFEKIGVDLNLS